MSKYINTARQIALQTGERVSAHVLPTMKKALETQITKNAEYVVKDEQQAKKLMKQLVYTNIARIPKAIEVAEKEALVVKEQWKKRNEMSVKEIAVAGLFAAEAYAWFCLGEVVGRGGSLTGY